MRSKIVKVLKLWDLGVSKIFGRIYGVITFLSLITLLKVYDISFSLVQIFAIVIVLVFLIFVSGVVYDHLGFWREEQKWDSDRNEYFVKIKQMLLEMKNNEPKNN
jgi:hypothetical protein